jgi:ribosome-binding protein aMBF1 (putative translation factor)
MSLAHQDWKPVIIHKIHSNKDKDKDKKTKTPGHSLDDNKDKFKHAKIDRELSQNIIKRRCELKMDRKQLALKVCIKVELLAKYETGKAIIDVKILNKLKRILKF